MTVAGGPVFWILVVLAVVAVVTYFERFFDLRRAQIDYRDFLDGVVNILDSGNDAEALSVCEDVGAPVASVVATAIRHRGDSTEALREAVDSQGRAEIGRLDRRLAVLAIIGQTAPLLGLLGTVIGFAKAVMTAGGGELVSRAELIGASMEAMVSAAVGLCVAIAAAAMYGSLRVRLDRIVVELEAAASQIFGYLVSKKEMSR